jgi:mRNA interferase MazF
MTTPPQNLMTRRGDVVLALFPNADLRSAKPRLAVVLQVNDLDAGLPQIVVAMITSQLSRAGHPSRVLITLDSAAGKDSGLQSDSVVMTDNLATIQLSIVARVIGVLPMEVIDRALKHTLGLSA